MPQWLLVVNLNNSSSVIYLILFDGKGCFVQFVACRLFKFSVFFPTKQLPISFITHIGLLLLTSSHNQLFKLLLSNCVKQVNRANYFRNLIYSEIIVGPLIIETLFQPSSTSVRHLVHSIHVMKNILITNGLFSC